MTTPHNQEFGEWLRTVPFINRELTKKEYSGLTQAMDEAYDLMDFKLFDHLHEVIAKPGVCGTCGDETCGCVYHQQSCSHLIQEYEDERQKGQA